MRMAACGPVGQRHRVPALACLGRQHPDIDGEHLLRHPVPMGLEGGQHPLVAGHLEPDAIGDVEVPLAPILLDRPHQVAGQAFEQQHAR